MLSVGVGIPEWLLRRRAGGAVAEQIVISNTSVLETAAVGDLVGTLSVIGGSGTYTFALTVNAGGKFALDPPNRIEVNAALDFETATFHDITVTATNGVTPLMTKVIRISVGDVAEAAPTIVLSNNTVPEDTTFGSLVGLLSVTAGTGTYTFSMIDGAGGRFALDGANTSRLLVNAALDFETATSHAIQVGATNGITPITGNFTINVTDVAETPPGAGEALGNLCITKAA